MDLTNAIINQATAMSAVRLQSEMSVRVMKKALGIQEQAALSLIQAVDVQSSAQSRALQSAGGGQNVDILV